MKRYWPEKGEILHNGIRQYFEEDFGYLEALGREIARQETILRVTEEPALGRHIQKMRDVYGDARWNFVQKWNTKK